MLTAAIRDLHLCYPGRFATDVRTPFPEIWEKNRYITRLDEEDPRVQKIEYLCSLVSKNIATQEHSIHKCIRFFNKRLSLKIKASSIKGNIQLSKDEKMWISQVAEIAGNEIPYWVILASNKSADTLCGQMRCQKVVSYYRGKIQFVQIGASEDHSPSLKDAIDLRGKTNLRQLIRLVYHAQGVVCPVSPVMHLAAAVEMKPGMLRNRPCVVIAAKKNPSQAKAYLYDQHIHPKNGFNCFDNEGCYRPRIVPPSDRKENNSCNRSCVDVVEKPKRRGAIFASDMIHQIDSYFRCGELSYLSPRQVVIARRTVLKGEQCKWEKDSLEGLSYRQASERYIKKIGEYPKDRFSKRGIVICAGGVKYLTCAWICVNMLRKWNCTLPIEIWHIGKTEIKNRIAKLLVKRGVKFVEASLSQKRHPVRILHGWSLKACALLYCRFKEVLLLDADNVPVKNPEFLFNCNEFKRTGAVFWPDFGTLGPKEVIWKVCGVRYRNEPAFESGQVVVNKERCWKALSLAVWYNEHADFYYQHILGDKDTFHMAFRKLGQPYSMPKTPIQPLQGVMCQHDFRGRRVFQHRNLRKWRLRGRNPRIKGFLFELDCLRLLNELRRQLGIRSLLTFA